MTKNKLKTVVALALMGAAAPAVAQTAYVRPAYQFPTAPTGPGPASVQVPNTPLYVTPYIGFAAGYDDNLFLTNGFEKSSPLYITSPGFKVDARSASGVFQFSYDAQLGRYSDSSADNYNDQQVRGQFDTAFDRRNFLRVGLDYVRGHDPRGSTDRPFGSEPDHYELTTPYATYAFGAPGAQGRIELYASEAQRRYLNNREITVESDRDNTEYGAAFFWRALPRTSALFEVRRTNIDYKSSSSLFSGDETRYYVGVTWEATAQTTGTIKIGRLERDFDNNTFPSFSGPSYEALITWLPRTYSRFDFFAARLTNESTGLGSFILTSVAGATWTHDWNSRVTTGLNLRYQKDEYQDFDRNDDTSALGLKVGYKFRRWLTLGAEYTYTHRNSNIPQFEYDKNLYFLTATLSM